MPKALVLSFFPAFAPSSSGGELRLRNLYRSISRDYDVTLLTSTDFGARFEEVSHTPGFRELRFPKDELWRRAYATLEAAGASGDLSGLAFAIAVSDPTCRLRQVALDLARSVDMVIHEFPFSEPIFAGGSAHTEIYNSHNFEIGLLSSIVRGPGLEEVFAKLIRLETNLVGRSKHVFATSTADAEKFRLFYGVPPAKLGLCPNGYDNRELGSVADARRHRSRDPVARPKLLFTGSAHYPNVEALNFLAALARELPECDILIGGGVSAIRPLLEPPSNFIPLGAFDAARKSTLLEEADIFLNPVILGSGTSLKAIEALGSRLPMVSTPEGVRGLDLKHGTHAAIVSRQEFAVAVRKLLADGDSYRRLAKAGLDRATASFTWDKIAAGFTAQIGDSLKRKHTSSQLRPLALALNDFSVEDTSSGGKARISNLHDNLDADIVLVSFGATYDLTLMGRGRLHVTIAKTAAHEAFEAAINAGQKVSVNDAVAMLFATSNQNLRNIVAELSLRANVVIFEHCFMAPLLDIIRLVRPDLPIVYSAQNVEEAHKADLLLKHTLTKDLTAFIAEIERRLVAQAALIVCCTDADAKHFAKSGVTTIVAPNGSSVVDREALTYARSIGRTNSESRKHRVGFLGSSHGPNIEAANFIVVELAPAFPEVQFELVGGVCTALLHTVPNNVCLRGIVSDVAKTQILAAWDIALNPVSTGGGSSVKLPDYLAHGLATINTPAGARGFPVGDNGAGCVVPLRDFGKTLAGFISNPRHLNEMRARAYRYAAETLSWRTATAQYRDTLATILVRTAPKPRSSLLVVTYRYTEPPLGGAEEYLIEVLKYLRCRFDRIDLAAINVVSLTNQYHFGCHFSENESGPPRMVANLFDRVMLFEPDPVPQDVAIERSRRIEIAWMHEEFMLHLPFLSLSNSSERPQCFSGVFGPENHGGLIRRWTAPEFSFAIPGGSRAVMLEGWTPEEKTISITLLRVPSGGKPRVLSTHRQKVAFSFREYFLLPPIESDDPLLLLFSVKEHHAHGDHRPLGILLDGVTVLSKAPESTCDPVAKIERLIEQEVNLADDYESQFRAEYFELWVKTLQRVVLERSDKVEEDFAAVRGPHSRALQAWLAENAGDYASVLIQGIPFDVIPSSVATLRQLPNAPRIVTLPHFHGDDRFYYWRRYLDSLKSADQTLVFSNSINDVLGRPAGFRVVPGGGVRTEECVGSGDVRQFRKVHELDAPFFLVLGRKTPSKGYDQAISAQQALRKQGEVLDIVIIGPDEDGKSIQYPGVHYLGRQPREVVRGALNECLGLVTMSASESFGIVICESWLFGKPVIANRACYSFRELVTDGETGLLVTTNAELQEAMRRLASNPEQRERFGRAGQAVALERFSWRRVANEIYESLQSRRFPVLNPGHRVASPPSNQQKARNREPADGEKGVNVIHAAVQRTPEPRS